MPTLTKNPLELILQVFPVVLALAYLFHQLLLRTFLAILHQHGVDRHETCDSRSLRSSSTSAKFASESSELKLPSELESLKDIFR